MHACMWPNSHLDEKKMKYNFARETWAIFMEDFLYFEITKAKILPCGLNLYWVY